MMGSINLTARAFTKQPSIDRRVFANDRRVFQIGRRVFLIGRRVFATGRRVFLIGRRVSAKGYSEAVVRKGLTISAPSWTATPARADGCEGPASSSQATRRVYGAGRSRLEFSLSDAVLTTRSSKSHYRSLISLPGVRILTTSRYSHYQEFEFSLPVAVLTTRASDFHYRH